MNRRRLILFGALALMAAGVVALWPRGPKEPVYQGKKLSYWIQEASRPRSETDSNRLQELRLAFTAIGTNAVPYLLAEFESRQSKLSAIAFRWLPQKTAKALGFDDCILRHGYAVSGFFHLGTNSAAALPILASYLNDARRRADAAWAMTTSGEAALPYLLKAPFTTTNSEANAALMNALGIVAHQNEGAIPLLIDLTGHTNDSIRADAATCLNRVTLRNDLVIPALVRLLTDASADVRRNAADSLCSLGDAATNAIPQIRQMLQDPNLKWASWVSNVTNRIDPAALPR